MSPESLDIKFTLRLPANLISNVIFFVLNVIIGLALVPFFLSTLGTLAYGLIPLATSITSFMVLIIDSLNQSVSRFLTVDLQRADKIQANETFNTALFGTLGIILLLTPFVLIVAWYAPVLFNISNQSASDVILLFAFIFSSVLIRAWSSNFMVILFAHNRLDLRNYVDSTNIIMQLVSIVLLFQYLDPSLVLVGISYVIGAIVSLAMVYLLSQKIDPDLRILPKLFVQSRFREIGRMSFWVIINSFSYLLTTQIALFIVNVLFGGVAGTEYSLAILWITLLLSVGATVTNLFTPMIFSYYSKNDFAGLVHFSTITIKFIGLWIATPIALVCVFSPQLLTLWVGEEFTHLSSLIWVLVPPIIFQIMVSCISPITIAYDRVRSLVLLTIPIGILNVIMAFLLPQIFNIGIYGVAIAGIITLLLRYGLVTPVFVAYVLKIPKFTYLKNMMYGIGGLLILSTVGIALTSIVDISTIPMLVLTMCSIAIAYLIFVLKIVLNPEERIIIRSCLPGMLQRCIPSWVI